MYQQFPGTTQMPQAEQKHAPPSVVTASRLMYAGAVASIIYGVGFVLDRSSIKTAILKHSHTMTATQASHTQQGIVIGGIAGAVIAAAVWVFMSRMSLRGRKWARILGTILFGYYSLQVIIGLAVPLFPILIKLLALLVWVVGLAATILLWRRQPEPFFS